MDLAWPFSQKEEQVHDDFLLFFSSKRMLLSMTISYPPHPQSCCALFGGEDIHSRFHQSGVVLHALQMAVVAAVAPVLSKNANHKNERLGMWVGCALAWAE